MLQSMGCKESGTTEQVSNTNCAIGASAGFECAVSFNLTHKSCCCCKFTGEETGQERVSNLLQAAQLSGRNRT